MQKSLAIGMLSLSFQMQIRLLFCDLINVLCKMVQNVFADTSRSSVV